jgi:hypothetical protein
MSFTAEVASQEDLKQMRIPIGSALARAPAAFLAEIVAQMEGQLLGQADTAQCVPAREPLPAMASVSPPLC